MKISKKLLTNSVAAIVAATGMASANAIDIAGKAGVASAYYWRGLTVSDGPQVWADVSASVAGAYAGVWASSEGFGLGPEYDIYGGYSAKFGEFGIDVGAVTYVYSLSEDAADDGGFQSNDPGDFSDAYIGLSFMGASLKYYDNIAEAPGNYYATASYTISSFTFTYGTQTFSGEVNGKNEPSYQHFDVTYAYNENLSLTVGTVFDRDDELDNFGVSDGGTKIDTGHSKVVVAYSIPLK
jgi:uncharacterized protein (TIGR02001 family)